MVRDFSLYRRLVVENPALVGAKFVTLDNRERNLPIPVQYNRFLDNFDFSHPAWLVFCHEDFEIREPLAPLLKHLSSDSLYGPIGATCRDAVLKRNSIIGRIDECRREGGETWEVGKAVPAMTLVETFDCCCLIAHSSLIRELRFDPKLEFDLYVEDFCANAKVQHGIVSRILPFAAVHHSGSHPTARLYRHLEYLRRKYPHDLFHATCVDFGRLTLPLKIYQWLHPVPTKWP